MEISKIIPHIEALIFAADRPLQASDILELLNNAIAFLEDRATPEAVDAAIEAIVEKYSAEFYAFEVRQSGGGYQFLTKKDYYQTVAQLNGDKFLKRLSTAALETLAIIAYRQPVSKGEIEYIRGVSSDYSLQKLLEKELISIAGRSEDLPGKPLLYTTSKAFMDYFGINSPKDLPKLREVFDEEILQPTLVNNEEERAALEEAAAGFLAVSENGELTEEIPEIPEAYLHEHQAKLEIDTSLLEGQNIEGLSEQVATEEETPSANEDVIEDISAEEPEAEEPVEETPEMSEEAEYDADADITAQEAGEDAVRGGSAEDDDFVEDDEDLDAEEDEDDEDDADDDAEDDINEDDFEDDEDDEEEDEDDENGDEDNDKHEV
ncbi:SMC-Scp complex subunit ScpB [Chitinophaga parva]|uniref:SMC-Scp complex subunit ScpB n=1 Tax=Chitinophaga parva TaxID=2169414 RepID=A0A2T7BN54_9BACT|nr:SMC-Scp complex subunit ScpB [Chitinophaga parva]PUZ29051.1 SMC-Scp complex subunit ScpB [Chitinophaga parva]